MYACIIYPHIVITVLRLTTTDLIGFQRPIHDAAERGRIQTVKACVESGCPIDVVDHRGRTALYIAALNGHAAIVDYLIQKGANVDKGASWKGYATPLHVAASRGRTKIVERLLKGGATIDIRDTAGITPLMEAAWSGQADVVHMLIEKGANARAVSKYQQTSLHVFHLTSTMFIPEDRDYKRVIDALVDHGLDINARDQDGNTPLINACIISQIEIIEHLLDRGADPLIANKRGVTAITIAKEDSRKEIVELLEKLR